MLSEQILGICHPLVNSMYLKKDYGERKRGQEVLVIETNFPHKGQDNKPFDEYMTQLLQDLPDLQEQVAYTGSSFSRVDIRFL